MLVTLLDVLPELLAKLLQSRFLVMNLFHLLVDIKLMLAVLKQPLFRLPRHQKCLFFYQYSVCAFDNYKTIVELLR